MTILDRIKLKELSDTKDIDIRDFYTFIWIIMKQPQYKIDQTHDIAQAILDSGAKVVKIAWASASGKTTVAKALVEELQQKGKKVLMISSDNYYQDHTRLQAVIYGSFDHPSLIRYHQLQQDLENYLDTQKWQYPQYSFKDSRVTSYQYIDQYYDIIVIEWLYTISQLKSIAHQLTIMVTSDTEELIIRRLIRDQQRIGDTASQIVHTLESVFSMWNVYGNIQKKQADIIVHNNYDILSDKGTLYSLVQCKMPDLSQSQSYQHHNFIYNSPEHYDQDYLQISEVYQQADHSILDHTSLYKILSWKDLYIDRYTALGIDFNEYGMVAQLHTLMQLAWLQLVEQQTQVWHKIGEMMYLQDQNNRYQQIVQESPKF